VETAQLAIRAALTGHLVFSTLHTNSAAGAIPRLLDMGVEPFLLSATLVAVVAQRLVRKVCDGLVRKVCDGCGEPAAPDPAQLAMLGLDESSLAGAEPRAGRGCGLCRQTGYRGRMAVFEYLNVDPRLRQMIAERRDVAELEQAARDAGQTFLREDAITKFRDGRTTLSEVLRVVS